MTTRPDILGTLLPGFVGTELPGWLDALLSEGLAGVCLFGSNIESAEQLSRLTAAIRSANPLALIAIDEEGGDVTRLHYASGSPYPGNALLGRIDDSAVTEAVAARVGAELRRVGIDLDFAPDVDVNSNPDNPVIGVRSFGVDPTAVGMHSAAWTKGLQQTGVAATIKHFPGHGDTAEDSHLALPVVRRTRAELSERELVPFRDAIAAGAAAVMTSHILLPLVDPEYPATFSSAVLQGILRGELGFTGVIVTDALDMKGASGLIGIPEAAVRALGAGCELLCLGTDNSAEQLEEIVAVVTAAVAAERLPAVEVTEAAGHVRALSEKLRAGERDIPVPEYEPDADSLDGTLAGAFALRDGVGAELGRGDFEDAVVVRVETLASMAIGVAPWGPFAAGYTGPVVEVNEGDEPAVRGIPTATPVIVIGKDNHRHPWVAALVDELRRSHGSVLVVDMGWPSDDRRYADIATFGASRLVGAALITLLSGGDRSTADSSDGGAAEGSAVGSDDRAPVGEDAVD